MVSLLRRIANAYNQGREKRGLELEESTVNEAEEFFGFFYEEIVGELNEITERSKKYGVLERFAHNIGYLRGRLDD